VSRSGHAASFILYKHYFDSYLYGIGDVDNLLFSILQLLKGMITQKGKGLEFDANVLQKSQPEPVFW
jgi:hypothetical protein